jgi:hypothetical protein
MADAELKKYFDLTCTFTAFSHAIDIDLDVLKNSYSNSHQLIKYLLFSFSFYIFYLKTIDFLRYSAAALSARACGHEKHFRSLLSDAVMFSSVLEGDISGMISNFNFNF